jgi:23S rRNA (cytosine1962-C5)-methyltransferase
MDQGLVTGLVTVRKRGAARIRSGHVWIYRSDILKEKDVEPGAIVTVEDERGAVIGKAFYSSKSQITLRFLSRSAAVIDESFFEKRFDDADRLREQIGADPKLSRRISSEGDFLPGLIVDRYEDYLVVQTLTQGAARLEALFTTILRRRYAPRAILYRNDNKIRELEGLPLVREWAGEGAASVVVNEDGIAIELPLEGGQKTGGYLDQRDNHRAARRYARGRALDGFCYVGGFALHLAKTCDTVEAVDSSAPAVQMAAENARRNNLQNVRTLEANVFDYLRERFAAGDRYDMIVLDPPPFARNRESLEGALRGYKEINNRAMRILKEGGTLVTCSCSHHVSEGLFAEMLAEAARDAGCWVRVLERRVQAGDHPILLGVPETLYLKCFVLEIRY